MARCSVCGRPAIAYIPYQRRHYCAEHLVEFIESKVERDVKRYKMIRRGDRVLAAVSGGKDSATLLGVLSALSDKLGYELVALHIDLGIGDYSRESRRATEELAKALGVPLIVVSVRDATGYGIPEMALRVRRPACSVCGTVKRYIYNAAAVELGADSVATGHNADDIAAYALKNFLAQDLEAIGKLQPVTPGIEGLAARRIRPLYRVYERESYLYTIARGLPHYHRECPHADLTSLDFNLKQLVNRLEEQRPSLKSWFLSNLAKRANDYSKPGAPVRSCSVCGLLSSTDKCAYCRLTERLTGKPLGPETRRLVREAYYSSRGGASQ